MIAFPQKNPVAGGPAICNQLRLNLVLFRWTVCIMDIPDEPPGGSRRASRRGSDGFASPSITSNRSRRKAKPLEEEAMENIHAFFQSVENHLESMSVAEQQEATFLLAQLDSLAPPNWNRHWRDNLQQSLRTVESCYDDFFSCGGKCTLWPNGLRNGLTPTRTQPGSIICNLESIFIAK